MPTKTSPAPKKNDKPAVVGVGVSMYSGPIPDASQLERYEQVLPGSADRILKMAEKQSAHRQNIENKVIDSNIKNSRLGQIFAFSLATVIIIGAFVLIIIGKSLIGMATILAEAATLVGIFIYNKESERKELKDKRGK